MKILDIVQQILYFEGLEGKLSAAKEGKPQLLEEVLKRIGQIETSLDSEMVDIRKLKSAYELKEYYYKSLMFDKTFLFDILKRTIGFVDKKYGYTEEGWSSGMAGMDSLKEYPVEFTILADQKVIDSLDEVSVTSTRGAIAIINRCIKNGDNIFVFLSDNMTRLPNTMTSCPQHEIKTTDINQYPIFLYEPTESRISRLVEDIKEYAKIYGTDFDIDMFIDSYKQDPNKYLDKK